MCDITSSPGFMIMDPIDIDPNFEPQTRARSNTWPLPRPDNFVDQDLDEKPAVVPVHLHGQIGQDIAGQVPKKNSSRRNAWGNMSYADLITQAIQSSPETRLTLAQIYEWMVQNVPYFKDKGDSNSSAGWKNSIRHNLSLHNRFMRVQNEGTGKSSWWMINPEAKPGKAARRRATSMETSKYEKKRGRVKKKVEALRNGQTAATPSPSSSISEGQDMFPESPVHHGFQLSPDFRPRASSNASSCGRLSPIPAIETDLHDSEVPPLSPLPWNPELGMYMYDPPSTASNPSMDRFSADQLVESLTESMKLRSNDGGFHLSDCALKPVHNGRSPQAINSGTYTISYKPQQFGASNSRVTNGDYRPQPPPYQKHSPVAETNGLTSLNPVILHKKRSPHGVLDAGLNGSSYTLTSLQNIGSNGTRQTMSPTDPLETKVQPKQSTNSFGARAMCFGESSPQQQHILFKDSKDFATSTLLQQQQLQGSTVAQPQTSPPAYHQQSPSSGTTSLSSTANHVVGHLLYNSLPQDLDFDSLQGGLECDVDQVIRHELSVDGNLDFNFDPMNGTSNGSSHPVTMTTTRSWVH